MLSHLFKIAAGATLLLTISVCGLGQSNGLLRGVARNAAGANVSGVTIVFTNQLTSESRRARTEANGSYEIQLPPGAYRVTVALPHLGKFDKDKNYGTFALARGDALENLIIEGGKEERLDVVVEEAKPETTVAAPADKPLGYPGKESVSSEPQITADRREARDRWRIGFPEYAPPLLGSPAPRPSSLCPYIQPRSLPPIPAF